MGNAKLLVVLLMGLVLIFGCTQQASQTPPVGTPPNTTPPATTPPATKPPVTTNPPAIGKAAVTDCKVDLGCFIKASENCDLAKVKHTYTFSMFGVNETVTSYYEIKGMDSGKCVFYIRTDKIDLAFPPQVPQETVKEQQALYDKLEGRDGTCKFVKESLTAVLKRWQLGNFSFSTDPSQSDYSGADCTGSAFSADSGATNTASGCKLKSPFGPGEMSLLEGISMGFSVSGFSGSEKDLVWRSENPVIISVAFNGSYGNMTAKKAGTTKVTITDNSVGKDCFISLDIKVTPAPYGVPPETNPPATTPNTTAQTPAPPKGFPPTVYFNYPTDGASRIDTSLSFGCTVTGDKPLSNLTLIVWNAGSLYYNSTVDIHGTSGSHSWALNNLSAGNYTWTCKAYSYANVSSNNTNRSFSITAPTAPPATPNLMDCGLDYSCFTRASVNNCQLAKVIHSVSFDTGGYIQSMMRYYEIRGIKPSGKCTFYFKTRDVSVWFYPGFPPDQMDPILANAQQMNGKDGLCEMMESDLAAMLLKWRNGNFSSGDFIGADCTGSYFS